MGLIESLLHCFFPPAPEPLGTVRGAWGRSLVVRGRVVARDLIESPLTARRCVYYRYLVEEWRRSSVGLMAFGGNAEGLWHAVDADEAIAEFYVDDGTGRAVVEPAAAQVLVVPPCAAERVEMPSGSRATEVRIEPGDWIEVVGVIDLIADLLDGERGYREQPTRVALRAAEGGRLTIRLTGKATGP